MTISMTGLGRWMAIALVALASMGAGSSEPVAADAAKARDVATLRALLKQRVDINVAQPDGATALHWAVQWQDLEAVDLLLRAGARVAAANEYGVTPLELACANGQAPMVERLLKAGVDANAALSTGQTPLMSAARTGSVASVAALLAHGARVDSREPVQDQTALMWAVGEGHEDVARMLVRRGADLRAKSKGGYTSLLFAVRKGNVAIVRTLLEAGANVNDVSTDGVTPLVMATLRGHWDLAKVLLERGADANADDAGFTALHWAAGTWETSLSGASGSEKYRWAAGLQPGKLDLVKVLLAYGADPNARITKKPVRFGWDFSRFNSVGATPFILASVAGNAEIMRALLAVGADPRLTTNQGVNALMAAAGAGWVDGESLTAEAGALDAVKFALQLGLDVNLANAAGETALHGAALRGADSIVQFLVEQGADINAQTKRGETPLTTAEGGRNAGVVGSHPSTGALLRKLGAK
jgi:ankyrin repeat protein